MRIEQTVRTFGQGGYLDLYATMNEIIREMAKDNWTVLSITSWGDTLIVLFQRMVS